MYSPPKRKEKPTRVSITVLFLKLVQVNLIFTDNVHILYLSKHSLFLVQTIPPYQRSRYLGVDSVSMSKQSLFFVQTVPPNQNSRYFDADSTTVSKQSVFLLCRPPAVSKLLLVLVQTVSLYLSSRYFAADRTTVSQNCYCGTDHTIVSKQSLYWYRTYHRIKTFVILAQTVPPHQSSRFIGTDHTTVLQQSLFCIRTMVGLIQT